MCQYSNTMYMVVCTISDYTTKFQEEFYGKYSALKDTVSRFLRQNAYSDVNLSRLFEGMFVK